jgi:transposase-like protein
MTTLPIKKVAKCPHCKAPHDYVEVRFPIENDSGYWKVDCQACEKPFIVELENPRESAASYYVSERHEVAYAGPADCVATEIVAHNLNLNRTMHRFNFDAPPIYLCQQTGHNLEIPAREALADELGAIKAAYGVAINYAMKGRTPDYQHVVVHIDTPCKCQAPHTATFYARFLTNGDIQESSDEYLLAGVSRSDLPERLDGLFSKSEIMAFLEKLIIRWHLTADQIIVASPFVGHQWLSKEAKMAMWTWLLAMLDPRKSVFITRKRELTAYKNVLEDVDGLNHAFLSEYGLESKLVSADTRRQDFHAKFFIGIAEDQCEVLSGSANLTTGPSIENISFRAISPKACHEKYIGKIDVALPAKPRVTEAFVLVTKVDDHWRSAEGTGSRLA